jgi:two-component system sensor histidine kinase RegB
MPASTTGAAPPSAPLSAPSSARPAGPDKAAGLKNLQQLIQLRWIAVFGQVLTIEVVHYGLRIAIPVEPMLTVLGCLVAFNVLSLLRARTGRRVTSVELLVALLVDVAALTAQLYLSGGATNPFVFLYLLQVILGAVLLPAWATWTMVGVTSACFAALALWAQPLALAPDHHRGLASPYMMGTLVSFALTAALLVTFITRIVGNLRERDGRLAALRQRAAEEEHIVRMGLLASGAAHELGTPLSTLAVILGDWQHLPHFSSEPELADDVAEMQAQVARCKAIVSGILLSAGEARGESSRATTLNAFLDEVVQRWRQRRPCPGFVFDNQIGDDLAMVADSAIQQMMVNVLDNAAEVSPEHVRLQATRSGDQLVLTVRDRGPGFASQMLAQLGKPYQSSKGQPGRGLGLFLVVNVARTLGGYVAARNLDGGGAEVRITLPLPAIALQEEDSADDR